MMLSEKKNKDKYNDEPVSYCVSCLSLKIIELNSDISYCDVCTNTEINQTSIEEWNEMYKDIKGHSFMEKK